MGFIQAPSYIPEKPYDMWGGIADIFGDVANIKERTRQRERQRIADAQSAASHKTLQHGRSLANQLAAAKLDTYKKGVEHLEWDPNNYDALINQAKKTGNWGSLAGVLPKNVVINLKGLTDYQNKIDLGLQRAIDSKNKQAYDALRIKKLEADSIYTDKINELNLATGGAKKRTAESAANVAGATEQSKIDYAANQNESARIRKENAFRTQQEAIRRGENLKTVSGQNFRPVDRASVPRGGNVARIPGVSDQSQQTLWRNQFNQALNELSSESPSTYTPERRAELTANIGLADVASSKIGWPELDEKIKTSGYSRVQLNKELASFMKDIAGSSDDFTADEQVVSSEAILEALLQLQNINPQKDWLSEYRQIKADKTNFIRETGSRSWGTLGLKDVNWDPLTSEEITLTMLLKESKKRQDPQYENDKKRFKDKFGWLPKWA